MNTTFFLTEQLTEKDIKRIKYLQETKKSLFEEITKWFLQQNEFPRINSELTKEFALKAESNAEEVNNAFTSIYWINNVFVEYENDKPADFVEDLKSINPDTIVDEKTLLNRLNEVFNISEKYRTYVKIQKTKGFGAPVLKHATTSVVVKPVIEKRFEFDKQNIKEYNPKIITNVPCVLIELEDSNDKHLSFQMDLDSFERFINDLISLQIELNSVKNDLN